MASRLPGEPPVISGLQYIRPLGVGGFADVFLYEQNMPRRLVAVKVLLRDVVDDDTLRMFHAEADVMALLSAHPAVLTIHEASVSADGRPYLVVEYCQDSFANRYREEVIAVPEVLDLGVRIGSALETSHRSGLLHRDIKPSNLLVTEFGSPVLSDFGIAVAVNRRNEHENFALSVPWSAPEVIEEASSGSVRTDVWSLGATIYALLAGKSPFEVAQPGMNSPQQLQDRIRKARYIPINRRDVSPQLEAVLRKAMAKNPQARHGSAAEFAHELSMVQQSMGLSMTALEYSAVKRSPEYTQREPHSQADHGPVRSMVDTGSQRPPKVMRPKAPSEPVQKTLSLRAVVWIVVGAVAVTAAAVAGLMTVLG